MGIQLRSTAIHAEGDWQLFSLEVGLLPGAVASLLKLSDVNTPGMFSILLLASSSTVNCSCMLITSLWKEKRVVRLPQNFFSYLVYCWDSLALIKYSIWWKLFHQRCSKKQFHRRNLCFCAFFPRNHYYTFLNYYQQHFESLQPRNGTAIGKGEPGYREAHDGRSDPVAL